MLSPGSQVPDSSSEGSSGISNYTTSSSSGTHGTTWGILYPINCDLYKVLHMKDNNPYHVGRDSDCQYQLHPKHGFEKSEELKLLMSNISKKHFKIYKENDDTSSRGYSVILEDLSMNGTYVNGFRVGQGRKHLLDNTSRISLAHRDNAAFIFIDVSLSEQNGFLDVKSCEVAMKRKCGH